MTVFDFLLNIYQNPTINGTYNKLQFLFILFFCALFQ
jgi:hypothetical protein